MPQDFGQLIDFKNFSIWFNLLTIFLLRYVTLNPLSFKSFLSQSFLIPVFSMTSLFILSHGYLYWAYTLYKKRFLKFFFLVFPHYKSTLLVQCLVAITVKISIQYFVSISFALTVNF